MHHLYCRGQAKTLYIDKTARFYVSIVYVRLPVSLFYGGTEDFFSFLCDASPVKHKSVSDVLIKKLYGCWDSRMSCPVNPNDFGERRSYAASLL